MKTVAEFLNKISNTEWSSYEGKTLFGKIGELDIRFSLTTELANNYHDIESMPIQLVARVYVNGSFASTWGADGNADNTALVKFFQEAKNVAGGNEYQAQRQAEKQAKEIFKSL